MEEKRGMMEREFKNVPSEVPLKWMIRHSGRVKNKQSSEVSISAYLTKQR
jgi:hypothetical protein